MAKLVDVTALAEVFPEGEKIIGFSLEYDMPIASDCLKKEIYRIVDYSLEPLIPGEERTIIGVYTNDKPELSGEEKPGRYVIIETELNEKAAFVVTSFNKKGELSPFGPGPAGYKKPEEEKMHPSKEESKEPKTGPGPDMDYSGRKPFQAKISQMKDIRAQEGESISACDIFCTRIVCPDIDRFEACSLENLPYNLYVPEDYDTGKSYPLVLFIHDAGTRGVDPGISLAQGIGGVIWARPENQKKESCFVVCPTFGPEDVLTHDDFTYMDKLYKVKDILDEVCGKYSIDRNRIYTTGQSMGCMSSCQLMITYPDYFAGAILVAGQWDPVKCGIAMAKANLWILVSSNDKKAHPGMDAVTMAIVDNGGKVARFLWDGSKDKSYLNECAKMAITDSPSANVKYTLFEGSTVVPEGMDNNPGADHVNTWRVAYQIDAVRDWLLNIKMK